MKLWEANGARARITLKTGEVFEGLAYDYTSALDNEPDPESITIDHFELFAPEIAKIEILQDREE